MKRYTLSILLLIVVQQLSFSQWTEQNSTTSENLNAIQFLSEKIGYVVGNEGTILKTIDGGDNWTSLDLGLTDDISSLHFVNETLGFIGSKSGKLFKTENGGEDWIFIELDFFENIADHDKNVEVHFINAQIGFIGLKNIILKTTDGGITWYPTSVNVDDDFLIIYEFEFLDNEGYALNKNGILKTVDQGETWEAIVDADHQDYNPGDFLQSIEVFENNLAFAGSRYYGGLYRTEDSFESMSRDYYTIADLEFLNPKTGYAIMSLGDEIAKTTNGAKSWNIQIESNDLNLNDLFFTNENTGWAIGNWGKILSTKNGGSLTSNEQISTTNPIEIYPNPIKDEIFINFDESNEKSDYQVRLFDMNGQLINTWEEKNKIGSINVSSIHEGIYILSILDDHKTYYKKIVIRR